MKAAPDSAQMKAADARTITHYGIPSLVLMERAALSVCDHIAHDARYGHVSLVRIYAGTGNNGADALVCARLLTERGFIVDTVLVGDKEKATTEHKAQMHTLAMYGILVRSFTPLSKDSAVADYILDGILGIGQTRELSGDFLAAVTEINEQKEKGAKVIAIDVPTGVNADDGTVFHAAVSADETVTFAFKKRGMLLYPAAAHCGDITVADIGIRDLPEYDAVYIDSLRDVCLPERPATGNKGTFGKILIVAGSETIGGAPILAATAALRTGAGMVRVVTDRNNRDALLKALPEALIDTIDTMEQSAEEQKRVLSDALAWSDICVCGCGIGTDAYAKPLLEHILTTYDKGLVLDADALNLLAEDPSLFKKACTYADTGKAMILTPHLAEFARLYKEEVSVCKERLLSAPKELADRMGATVLCKDACSITADSAHHEICINTSGNDGMATAGSGDVLAGIAGALLAVCKDGFESASYAAYLHGAAGDRLAETGGKSAMTASDIASAIGSVMADCERSACGYKGSMN